jgi:hypothetical protein
MNIGILTFHHTTNYGATLQAYALSKFLEGQGHQVEFINYQPKMAVKVYRDVLYFKAKKKEIPGNLLKDMKMRWFVKKHMKVNRHVYSKPESLKKGCFHYDVVIVGSDEVWNINSFRGYDMSYFLDFLDDRTKKISYAASFGHTTSLTKLKESISHSISKFDRVSVRDVNSLRLIQSECGTSAEKVLDPTFLVDFRPIIKEHKLQKYILVYGEIPDSLIRQIKEYSDRQNFLIVSVGYTNKIADINHLGASPEEWLSYFEGASYVFTSFFHGTIFSILFKKPFTVFSTNQKIQKLSDLLSDLNLVDRIYASTTNSINFNKIDYKLVFEEIDKKVLFSKAFLLESLTHDN